MFQINLKVCCVKGILNSLLSLKQLFLEDKLAVALILLIGWLEYYWIWQSVADDTFEKVFSGKATAQRGLQMCKMSERSMKIMETFADADFRVNKLWSQRNEKCALFKFPMSSECEATAFCFCPICFLHYKSRFVSPTWPNVEKNKCTDAQKHRHELDS